MNGGNGNRRPASLLAGLSDELRDKVFAEADEVRLPAGEWLFREGEPADSAFVVRSGRLDIVTEHPTEVVIRQITRGAAVGELGLLRGGVRSTSVRACRDSELVHLSRDRFESLIRHAPEFALALIHVMGDQIAANRAPATSADLPRSIAVIALDRGADADDVAAELAAELERHGSLHLFRAAPDRSESNAELLERAEVDNDRVLLVGGPPDDPWSDFCLREADVVVAVTSGVPDPEWLRRCSALRECELIVLDARIDKGTLAAIAPREVQVLHGAGARAHGIAVTARRLAGRAVGLVLSGGGARALAHLGVLDELEANGVVVDRLAGASMGAIVSGIAATGAPLSEITDLFERTMVNANPSNDYTLPRYSLIRGLKTRRVLEEAFGDRRIEELSTRWYCVSADLVSRQLVIHRTGRMVDAVYPSMALPGIFPPMPTPDGRLLVDGGVMDNLPVEPMAQRPEGPIIAVDVSQRAGPIAPTSRPRLEHVARRVRRGLAGSEEPVPRLRETLMRTMALGSSDTVAAGMRHADIVISPRVEGLGLLDWKNLPRAREAGRVAAREALEPALAQIESWK